MRIRKWHKFRASKQQFPTRQIDGDGARKGSLLVGHKAARVHLEATLGRKLDYAIVESTSHEWIFKFPIWSVPQRKVA